MDGRVKFEDSPLVNFVFKNMLHFLDSPVRRWFNDPVKILKASGVQPGLHVLEVGCGTGFFTIPAAEMLGDRGIVHAFDIHPLAVEQTAEKIKDAGLGNVKLTKTDALDTELPDEVYDLILILVEIPSPVLPLSKLLPEMHRLLKPGGSMAVWTGIPLWSPKHVSKSGLFTYTGSSNGVGRFTRNR